MVTKTNIITIITMIFTVLLISSVSAEFWSCFNKGEKINFCNPKITDRTAPNDGYLICMSSYTESEQCYNSAGWNNCNALTHPEECGGTGGDTDIDSKAPNLTIISPLQNSVYDSRSVLLSFQLNEKADVYYIDNINGKGRWIRVCQECLSYSGKRSFNEGKNDLTFKAIDVVGNTAYKNLSFSIDSNKPKIIKIEPKEDFVSTEFSVSYNEENINSVKLNYGNILTGIKSKSLQNCPNGKKQKCSTSFSLKEYDGQNIEYWFEITDIAGNIAISKKLNAEVDETSPNLNNQDSFWLQGQGKNNKYIYFTLNIIEKNFDSVSYIDNPSDAKSRWKTLCLRLKGGICEKKVSFGKGNHSIDVQIIDKAGNSISKRIGFDVS